MKLAPSLRVGSALRTLLLVVASLVAASTLARAGSALTFDRTNDYVTFGPTSALGVSTFTIETWLLRTGTGVSTSTGYGGINAIPLVTKGRAEVDGTNQDMNYFLGLRASDGVLVADFEEAANGASPGLNHPLAGLTPIASGVWTHAAVTYDGSMLRLFLNGRLDAELSVGQPPRADSIQHAALATAIDSTGAAAGFFKGSLDEVRIWNYARSAADLAASKDAEITSAAGLIGRWGMNEGSGLRIGSSSGVGVTGSLVNGPVWTSRFVPPATPTAPTLTRGPYLQTGTAGSVIIRWRTDLATDSSVHFGTSASSLTATATNATVTTEHIVKVSGLTAGTQYSYSIGSSSTVLASGANFTFKTAPPIGTAVPTRIWAIGDSGEGSPEAAIVRDAYLNYNGTRGTDVWLMLGDNAYETGLDSEYQRGLFDMYAPLLPNTVLWPTIGNHDTAESQSPPSDMPYYRIFSSLPAAGEAGGLASGTMRYYSFDYGAVHFICLDSMTSDRRVGSPMLTWLKQDLAATRQQWLIAYWHHAPYCRGVIDSDTDPNCTDMRTNVLPILEAGGVDLVLCGHSHDYERSFLLNGHYGSSSTFNYTMAVSSGSGRENGTGAYRKPPALTPNKGTVYAVAGSAAEVINGALNYPAMYLSEAQLGSLVIDINGNRLDAHLVRDTGAIDDYFTIVKDLPTATVPTAPSSLTGTALSKSQIALSWSDNSSNETGFYVYRSKDNKVFSRIATLGANVRTFTDAGLSADKIYYHRVSALNAAGESPASNTTTTRTRK